MKIVMTKQKAIVNGTILALGALCIWLYRDKNANYKIIEKLQVELGICKEQLKESDMERAILRVENKELKEKESLKKTR